MSYCLNPACPNPENLLDTELCQACGSKLLLRDRYRVLQELGRGGFGATFLAKDESLPGSPYCVIKQLRPAVSSPNVLQMARDLFRREAKTLGKIGNHPQVPRLLDYFESNQEFYLVQEYISGSTLQQEVKKNGPFSEAGVKQFLSEVLPMLQYIHSSQVIHRDIKPANLIRRSQDKKLVLIDFGAVKDKVSPTRANASEQTALTAYAIGTPGYAPPEQMSMRPVYASDIYAVGVTCVYLLTGKSPKDLDYDPTTGELMWNRHVHVSEHFATVLHKMLEMSVRHRYQNANEVLRALDLEPYLDSLAQSMVKPAARSNSLRNDSAPSSGDLSGSLFPSSPSARMAAAIRARQQKNGMDSTGMTGGSIRRGPAATPRVTTTTLERRNSIPPNNGDNSSGNSKPKLTAEDVVLAYTKGRRDFTFHDLSSLNLARATLTGANFHQARLHKINLQGANLFNSDFGRAGLSHAQLKDSNLARAYLSHADLQNADLRGADLSYAYLSNANLRGANLCGANLTGAKITDAQLAQARTNWGTTHPSGKRGIW
ncbi:MULTISPECIES: serine/threonine-protein kinase [unclassified Leptolyngbya]|uniref:serine/threonine-protein kinase n=1 Tax=unclassified Leptolyngbya TaxID=2650499 RepID=UPI0016838186|nr:MULTISPECIES: serine/threonine-protein kinase [unclassified Leptolyngbya]MBD1912510.1 pentapeptide repeat-containing protein [Leptolyngbya sp. FACHB-8]MBD2156479.1 pentapeptide repeat-containing protein [Leptolyngbya sp. FACHB-16]